MGNGGITYIKFRGNGGFAQLKFAGNWDWG